MSERVLEFAGYAILAVLANAAPMLAQCHQGLVPALGQGGAALKSLQRTFSFPTVFDTAPLKFPNGVRAEDELAPQPSPDGPFAIFPGPSKMIDSRTSLPSASIPALQPGSAHESGKDTKGRAVADDAKESSSPISREGRQPDPNQRIYYRNKLEFSLEGGWLPINIPFAFDFLLGDRYDFPGLYYTLVPVFASLRWQFDDVGGPPVLRGNWDATFTASVTVLPRGAETRYFSYIMGIRRNFVPHTWKVAPYLDGQVGLGNIDAKGPLGVKYAQGQNFTFTMNLGSGVRYNLNPRYSIEGGLHYMHISNLYLSEPKFLNYGINVYGPWAGINIRIGKGRSSDQ